jgi:predicted O-methyltransferase YrrM
MARMTAFLSPETILELGTSFGISAAYLLTGAPGAKLTTIEGDADVAKVAQQTFDQLGLVQIHMIRAEFDEGLERYLKQTQFIDLLFIDGNHTSAALVRYFNKLKPYFREKTVVVVDDLYWSADMQHGWKNLIADESVTQSVNCFHFGLLLFSRDFLEKQHHRTRLPLRSITDKSG